MTRKSTNAWKHVFTTLIATTIGCALSLNTALAAPPTASDDTSRESTSNPVTFSITRSDNIGDDVRVDDTIKYTITYKNNTKNNVTVWPTASNLTAVAVQGNTGHCRHKNLQPGATGTCSFGYHIAEEADISNGGFTPSVDWKITNDGNGNNVITTTTLTGEKITNINPTPRPREDGSLLLARVNKKAADLTGKPHYRIPAIAQANNGWILAAWDYRPNNFGDSPNPNSIVQRISKDGGKTFEPMTVVARGQDGPQKYGFSDPSYVVDQETGHIFLFFVKSYDVSLWGSVASQTPGARNVLDATVTHSTDNGQTWSEPQIITKAITRNPQQERARFATSGHGIQLKYGKYKGRLIQQYAIVNSSTGKVDKQNEKWQAVSVYSDDHGKTWQAGNPVGLGPEQSHMDENKVVELSDGSVMLNSRPHEGGANNQRIIAISKDGGHTYGKAYKDSYLPDPGNNAQITRAFPDAPQGSDAAKVLLYSSSSGHSRSDGLIRVSYNDGQTWTSGKLFKSGSMSYSTMQALSAKAGGGYALLYEGDNNDIIFKHITADWLDLRPTLNLGSNIAVKRSTTTLSLPIVNPTSTAYANVNIKSLEGSQVQVSSSPTMLAAKKTTYIPLKIQLPSNAQVGSLVTARVQITAAPTNPQDRSSTGLSFTTTLSFVVSKDTKDASTQTEELPGTNPGSHNGSHSGSGSHDDATPPMTGNHAKTKPSTVPSKTPKKMPHKQTILAATGSNILVLIGISVLALLCVIAAKLLAKAKYVLH